MPVLDDQIRAQIVMRYAEFERPSEIRDWLEEEHGIEVDLRQLWHYNPERANAEDGNASGGAKLARKWFDLFGRHRRRFLAGTADIGIANKAYRLKRLDRMAREAERMRNYKLAADLHEQAAKEMGDYYTNTTKVQMDVRGALAQLIGVPVDQLPDRRAEHLNAAGRLRQLTNGKGGG